MESTISATYLAKHLSDVLDRIRERGDEFIVERDGETIARLGPTVRRGITARELVRRMGDLRMPGDGFADDLEAIHAEQGVQEMPDWP